MIAALHQEMIYFLYYFQMQLFLILPYWMVGMAAGSLISVFLKDRIHGLMGSMQNRSLEHGGIFLASALGILSPLCMYGTVPLVASFARSGMRQDWIVAFMMSSILLNPQLLLYSFALGNQMAVMRLVFCFLGGCAAGMTVRLCFRKKTFYTFTAFDLPASRDTDPRLWVCIGQNLWRNVRVTMPYFLLGVALTALYQRYVPQEWVVLLFGGNRSMGTLMAAALGIPLYTCGGGTIPLLAAWLGEGMSPGSAIAFMIAGPATKLTNLGAVKIVLGKRNFLYYIAFSVLLASASGVIADVMGGGVL